MPLSGQNENTHGKKNFLTDFHVIVFHFSTKVFHFSTLSKKFSTFRESFPHLPKASLGGHRKDFSSLGFSGKSFRFTKVVFRGSSVLPNGIVRL